MGWCEDIKFYSENIKYLLYFVNIFLYFTNLCIIKSRIVLYPEYGYLRIMLFVRIQLLGLSLAIFEEEHTLLRIKLLLNIKRMHAIVLFPFNMQIRFIPF